MYFTRFLRRREILDRSSREHAGSVRLGSYSAVVEEARAAKTRQTQHVLTHSPPSVINPEESCQERSVLVAHVEVSQHLVLIVSSFITHTLHFSAYNDLMGGQFPLSLPYLTIRD